MYLIPFPAFFYSFIPAFLHSCILLFLHSCIPAFLRSCIPAFLHSCIPVFLHSCIPAFFYSCIPAFFYSCILLFLHSCIPAFLHSCIPAPSDPIGPQDGDLLDNFPVPCKDSIERLTNQWLGCVTPRGQPFGLIREYYGEKMALYFQFSGYGEARPVYEPTLPSHTNAFLISLSHPYLTLIEHVSDAYLLPLSPLSRLYLTLSMPPHPHLVRPPGTSPCGCSCCNPYLIPI